MEVWCDLSALIPSAIHPPLICPKETNHMEKKQDYWYRKVPFLACSQNEFTWIQPLVNKETLKLHRVMDGDLSLTLIDDEIWLMMKADVKLLRLPCLPTSL